LEFTFTSAIFSAFIVGLFSTLHCLGMCGGIIGALSLSLPAEVRDNRLKLLPYVAAYNVGRLGSYALAGAIAGGLGETIITGISPVNGHLILLGIAFATMTGIGLYLAGWFPRFSRIEKLGRPIWAWLEPLGRRLLPVKSPIQAVIFGSIWGWLPCGLVYSVLLWSTSSGGSFHGAIFMLAFGLGTLPAVITAGIVSGWMVRLGQRPYLKVAVGLSIVVVAFVSLAINLYQSDTASHQHHLDYSQRQESLSYAGRIT